METKQDLAVQIQQSVDGLMSASKEHVLSLTVGSKEELLDQIESYKSLSIDGINNIQAYKQASDGVKQLRKWRTSIEKARKEITSPIDKFKTDFIEFERELTNPILEAENHLKSNIQRIDDEKEAIRKALIIDRSQKLTQIGYNQIENTLVLGVIKITTDQLAEISEDEFMYYEDAGRKEIERREAEEKRMQAERDALKAERDALKAEREQLAKEMEELRALKAELMAQKNALNETYEEKTAPEPEPAPKPEPEPEPEPEVKTETVPEPEPKTETKREPKSDPDPEPMQYMVKGFEAFRQKTLEYITDPNVKMTRKTLIEFVENLEID